MRSLARTSIIVALCTIYASAAAQKIEGNSTTPKQHPAGHPAKGHAHKIDKAYPTEQSPFPVSVIASPDEARAAAADKIGDKQTARATLKAAEIAAQATEEQACWAKISGIASVLSTIIAGTGLYWVLKTFGETKRTASAAVNAANSAEHQVELAREEFIANNRPRLIVRNISITNEGGARKILYSVVNIGGARCKLVDSLVMTEFVGQGNPIRNLRAYQSKTLTERAFAPGQYYDELYSPSSDHMTYIESGPFRGMYHGTLYFTGALRYEDDLGNSRNAVFRRKYENGGFYRTDDQDHEFSD